MAENQTIREKYIRLRLNDQERRQIERLANRTNQNMSQAIRTAVKTVLESEKGVSNEPA